MVLLLQRCGPRTAPQLQIVEAFFELEHTLESTLAAVQQPNASSQAGAHTVSCITEDSQSCARA